MRWLPSLFGVLVAAGTLLGGAATARACSCAPSTVEAYFEKADLVFEGRVAEMVPARESGACKGFCGEAVAVRFAVVQRWKGAVEETQIIHTRRSGAACGFPFEEGRSYLVYAVERGSGHLAHLCGGTRMRENAGEHLSFLQAGVIPLDPAGQRASAASDRGGPSTRPVGCQSCALADRRAPTPLGAAAAALGLGLFMLRRRRRLRR